ncbi:hypothetical protein IBE11_04270 [Francisella tularensis subsp. novicida]|nr:hypothetical protein [Francisella tularensis subsp. novicida]MBK2349689.1 hypothetical protein [Francisella tularensis subsp. novicida]MBK2353196.1 hypothetical protein [Francisella tularensis subsp. novicida]MBK2354991.1 hypothetical protein [Francisella tularensis subsp. novicida]MBK2358606.1 hypothetical protein [Francisella tularensis subsp. novicida]
MSSLFFLLESMRFSPVKANSRILALGHKIRPGRPSTVTSHTMMNQIRNRAITRNNQKELEYTINDFILKTRSAQINNFFLELEGILMTKIAPLIQYNYEHLGKTNELLFFFKLRFSHLCNLLN